MMTHPKPNPTRNPKAVLLGKRIADAREQKGYTQAELAVLVGVTDGAIAQYETGRNLPKLSRIERIAEVLGVATDWLLTGGEPEEIVKAQTKVEEEALLLVRGIPADTQPAALAMLAALVSKNTK